MGTIHDAVHALDGTDPSLLSSHPELSLYLSHPNPNHGPIDVDMHMHTVAPADLVARPHPHPHQHQHNHNHNQLSHNHSLSLSHSLSPPLLPAFPPHQHDHIPSDPPPPPSSASGTPPSTFPSNPSSPGSTGLPAAHRTVPALSALYSGTAPGAIDPALDGMRLAASRSRSASSASPGNNHHLGSSASSAPPFDTSNSGNSVLSPPTSSQSQGSGFRFPPSEFDAPQPEPADVPGGPHLMVVADYLKNIVTTASFARDAWSHGRPAQAGQKIDELKRTLSLVSELIGALHLADAGAGALPPPSSSPPRGARPGPLASHSPPDSHAHGLDAPPESESRKRCASATDQDRAQKALKLDPPLSTSDDSANATPPPSLPPATFSTATQTAATAFPFASAPPTAALPGSVDPSASAIAASFSAAAAAAASAPASRPASSHGALHAHHLFASGLAAPGPGSGFTSAPVTGPGPGPGGFASAQPPGVGVGVPAPLNLASATPRPAPAQYDFGTPPGTASASSGFGHAPDPAWGAPSPPTAFLRAQQQRRPSAGEVVGGGSAGSGGPFAFASGSGGRGSRSNSTSTLAHPGPFAFAADVVGANAPDEAMEYAPPPSHPHPPAPSQTSRPPTGHGAPQSHSQSHSQQSTSPEEDDEDEDEEESGGGAREFYRRRSGSDGHVRRRTIAARPSVDGIGAVNATAAAANANANAQAGSHGNEVPAEYKNEVDRVFFEFLNKICSNLEATDSKGEPIHQTLMAKKMQRLDESPDFRPFKFRIQAFTNAFLEELARQGYPEDKIPMKKIRNYLWNSPYISRFNEDGKKAKSKGNHIWNIEAKKTPDGGWTFRPFHRRLAGMPPGVAYVGLRWQWVPRIWDPQASRANLPVQYSSPALPAWLSWQGDSLEGVPPPDAQSCDVTVEARFIQDGKEEFLSQTVHIAIAPMSTSSIDIPTFGAPSRRPSLVGDSRRIQSDPAVPQAPGQRAPPSLNRTQTVGVPVPVPVPNQAPSHDTQVIQVLTTAAQRVAHEALVAGAPGSAPGPGTGHELQSLAKQQHVLTVTAQAVDQTVSAQGSISAPPTNVLATAAQHVVLQAARQVAADRAPPVGLLAFAPQPAVTVNDVSVATQSAVAQAVEITGPHSTEVDVLMTASSLLQQQTRPGAPPVSAPVSAATVPPPQPSVDSLRAHSTGSLRTFSTLPSVAEALAPPIPPPSSSLPPQQQQLFPSVDLAAFSLQ